MVIRIGYDTPTVVICYLHVTLTSLDMIWILFKKGALFYIKN
jgi:hypothetical protein